MSEWQSQLFPGGLKLTLSPLFWRDQDPSKIAAVKECIEQVALSHGATYREHHFRRVDHLLTIGAMHGYVLKGQWTRAGQDVCVPRYVALALGSKAVILKKIGNQIIPFPGEDRDDTAVLRRSLRAFIHERPKDLHIPHDLRLSEYMERKIMGLMGAKARLGTIAEVARSNKGIMRVMDAIGAEVGTKETGPVLEYDGYVPLLRDRMPVEVRAGHFTESDKGGPILPYASYARWPSRDGTQGIVAACSWCPSSMSQSMPLVHLKSNGDVPEGDFLKTVLASVLTEAQAMRPSGIKSDEPSSRGPWIVIHGGRQEAYHALRHSAQEEVFWQRPTSKPLFNEAVPGMRIYCMEEKLNRALATFDGIRPRQLGTRILYPVIHDHEAVDGEITRLRPARRHGVVEAGSCSLAA